MVGVAKSGQTQNDDGDRFDEALRKARLTEAVHFDAFNDIRDAATLRLQILKEELAPMIAARPRLSEITDLALVPGNPPRLWLDLVSYVTMLPDPRHYRLVHDTVSGRKTLFETSERAQMHEYVTNYLAHCLIEREREARQIHHAVPENALNNQRRFGTPALVLAGLSGFSLGVLVLFIIGLWLSRGS